MPNKVLSTGVLIRDPASFNANVTIVNTGATTGQTAQVEIFDWEWSRSGASLHQCPSALPLPSLSALIPNGISSPSLPNPPRSRH